MAGLPPMLTYDIAQTSEYTGLSQDALRGEIRAGRLRAIVPRGATRGQRIRPEDVDEWMKECTA